MITDLELTSLAEDLVKRVDPRETDQVTFRSAQFDAGLAWVHFPKGRGGLGLTRGRQRAVDQVLRTAGATYSNLVVNPIGIGMAAPTLLEFGTDKMLDCHLRPIFTGEEIWCQLFSEPIAGSDLSGIATRAEFSSDYWTVNGQKVWTSFAHLAQFALLLARTDPSVPKHKGLSYFVLDMSLPGVEVRPLFQLTGDAEFNEVFLDDVHIRGDAMLGAEGEGWKIALTTLMNERMALGGGSGRRHGGPGDRLLRRWSEARDRIPAELLASSRDRVVSLWVRAEVQKLHSMRSIAVAAGGGPGPEGSMSKLVSTELNRDITNCILDLHGASGMLHEPGYPMQRSSSSAYGSASGDFLRARANTIEGGTSEVLRNIIGERVLGLPPDIRVDKDVAWRDVPNSSRLRAASHKLA